jgi:beta-lactamase superfamily II metal-dependent hydrolase
VSLTWLLPAAGVVTAWFYLWALGMQRLQPPAEPGRPPVDWVEAILLTLFADLWFASLGHGQWWVLFITVGLLIEGPVRMRHRSGLPPESLRWRAVLLGTLRLLGAGAILSLLL